MDETISLLNVTAFVTGFYGRLFTNTPREGSGEIYRLNRLRF